MARKFAHNGYIAISPNLHYREGSDDPVANSNSIRDKGGMPDARTLGDADGAIGYLRRLSVHKARLASSASAPADARFSWPPVSCPASPPPWIVGAAA